MIEKSNQKKANNRIVVSHQPQYFPRLELYNKILQSNKFIYLDEVKFKNKAWHAKTISKNNRDDIITLIVPCLKNPESKKIKDIKIAQHKITKRPKDMSLNSKKLLQTLNIKKNYLSINNQLKRMKIDKLPNNIYIFDDKKN